MRAGAPSLLRDSPTFETVPPGARTAGPTSTSLPGWSSPSAVDANEGMMSRQQCPATMMASLVIVRSLQGNDTSERHGLPAALRLERRREEVMGGRDLIRRGAVEWLLHALAPMRQFVAERGPHLQ